MMERFCANCTECLIEGFYHMCSVSGVEVQPYDCCPLHGFEKEGEQVEDKQREKD